MFMLAAGLLLALTSTTAYEATWESLDSRPLPAWYDDAKFGIFCHWGVYSVPGYKEWFWWYWKGDKPDPDIVNYMKKNYKPDYTYADFAKDFTAEFFDPNEFVDIVKSSGAKYFVLTSKHVEGYTMWPSKESWNWNSVDVGPKRDIVGELKASFIGSGVHFGLYFAQFEWFNPVLASDKKFNTTQYPDQVTYPQMLDLVNRYQPDLFWSDADWGSDEYLKSKEFLAWLYNKSPVKDVVVVNDRWGGDAIGKHGGFMTFDDHYDPGTLVKRKWENCLTMDKSSWGNRKNMKAKDVITVFEIIEQIARTVSCGGNVLLNVGPNQHGKIPVIFEDRLRELGVFLNCHSEALYGTKPWIYQNDTGNTWYTARYRNRHHGAKHHIEQRAGETIVYAWVLDVNDKDITLDRIKSTPETKITVMGTNVTFKPGKMSQHLVFPASVIPWRTVVRKDVLVLKIEYAATEIRDPIYERKQVKKNKQKHRHHHSSYSIAEGLPKMITEKRTVFPFHATWESLDSRPLPAWYDDAKFGIFCHWGVYSVPGYKEWFWWKWQGDKPDPEVVNYMNKYYKPGTTYADLAKDFTAEFFDPNEFADIVKSSGAKYFVLTSKHHEGFTLWPSKESWNWNSVDLGPKRDIVGDLKSSFNGSGVHFGLYFSQFEWFHPMFKSDLKNNTTQYRDQVSYPQMLDIVNRYQPDVVWSDGDWGMSDDYWKSKEFLAWLYNTSPVKDVVVVNDRWGGDAMGKHGGFMTYQDHYDPGTLLKRKWENCLTMDKDAWGNRKDMKAKDVITVFEIIEQIARTVSCGGNVLLNIGPNQHGKIPVIFEARLRELGVFLNCHSEALYGTKPWIYQNDTGNVWYTARYRNRHHGAKHHIEQRAGETIVYAWVLDLNGKDISLDRVKSTPETKVTIMGTNVTFKPGKTSQPLVLSSSMIPWRTVVRKDVLVLKIEYAASEIRDPIYENKQMKQSKKKDKHHYSIYSFAESLPKLITEV